MKVLICSDIHGILFYTKKVEELINRENVDKIVILGDVYYYGPRSIKEDTYEAGEVKDILNKYADKIIAVVFFIFHLKKSCRLAPQIGASRLVVALRNITAMLSLSIEFSGTAPAYKRKPRGQRR